jgi:hypothetical protein
MLACARAALLLCSLSSVAPVPAAQGRKVLPARTIAAEPRRQKRGKFVDSANFRYTAFLYKPHFIRAKPQ